MKKLLFLLSFFAWAGYASAQALYIDPATSSAIFAHSSAINSQLNTTNNNLTAIQRGQLAVSGQLTIVNDLQNKIFKGLSEVASIVRNLSTVKEISDIGIGIVEDVARAVTIARSDPVLLLFAEESAREFRSRATTLALEVSTFALQGGKNNLMDSGERTKLINHIASEMRILRGLAYGMERAMYWAKMRGIWRSLNPFNEWVNADVQIANGVLSEARYLKK